MSKALEAAKELVRLLEEQENEQECDIECCADKVELSTLCPGDMFETNFSNFIVLEHLEEGTLVITEGLIKESVEFGDSTNYLESELRDLIDSEIYEKIVREFGADNMVVHKADLMTLDGQNLYGTYECRVRPLTFDEARKYNALLVNKDLPDWYWTLTPWSSKERGWEYSVAVVSPSGNFGYDFYDDYCGVRPVCILKSNISVSKGE